VRVFRVVFLLLQFCTYGQLLGPICSQLSLSDSVGLYSSVILIYLLTTRQVPGYPISYPVGYPGNELPDNGSPRVFSVPVYRSITKEVVVLYNSA